jgi:signal transduction histidine kinase
MDVQMPVMDGFDTVQLLRQVDRTRYTPVIFVTAFGDIGYSARGYELGAFDFITKPFDAEVLRARIGALVILWQRGQKLEAQAAELRAQAVKAERERAARESAEADNRMKDEFLAVVSHELRTPLNAILGWAELLVGGTVAADRVQHGLETIARNARVQARLIEDLLDVSRIIAGKLKIARVPTDLASIARRAAETLAPVANTKNVGLEVVIEPGDHDVIGDAARLQQVIWNLLSNAVKFSPAGAHVEMTLVRTGDRQRLSVVDHGIGIEPSFLPYVFDSFRQAEHAGTRQHGGLGLGLAIAQHIVKMLDGGITAASEGRGRGATFTVDLPSMREHSSSDRSVREFSGPQTGQFQAVKLPTPRLDGLRVLFVDDEPDARELVTMVLGDAGAEVRTASSTAEALGMIDGGDIDVVVSDIGMPGEDGYALMRKLNERPERPPAIALSAFTSPQDRERALAAGFVTHLPKPLDAPALIAFIDRLARQ